MSMPKDSKFHNTNSKVKEVLDLFENNPDQVFTPSMIRLRLNIYPSEYIHTILSLLKKRGLVTKHGRGNWKYNKSEEKSNDSETTKV